MTVPFRILTATAIFDGHDASINIIRRVLQDHGAEIIHLGHNHSVEDIVNAAIQEDVDAIAISSYQGGHSEFFRYLIDCLNKFSSQNEETTRIQVFGGGGGTITEAEAEALQQYGVTRIFSSKDGAELGLEGMARYILQCCAQNLAARSEQSTEIQGELDRRALAKQISALEQGTTIPWLASTINQNPAPKKNHPVKVIGITGTGGSGKSTLIDELLKSLLSTEPKLRIAYLAIDPTRKKSGGALLGDRIRINCQHHPRLFMRSIATRSEHVAISPVLANLILLLKSQHFDIVLIETAGIGQSDSAVVDFVDESFYVMSKDYGAPSQLEKIEMLDFADRIILNKCDQRGSEDAYHHICKQWRRNHSRLQSTDESIPVYPMVASQFDDAGLQYFIAQLAYDLGLGKKPLPVKYNWSKQSGRIIADKKQEYLSAISAQAAELQCHHRQQVDSLAKLESYYQSLGDLGDQDLPEMYQQYTVDQRATHSVDQTLDSLRTKYNETLALLDDNSLELLKNWPRQFQSLTDKVTEVMVHGIKTSTSNYRESISHLAIPLVAIPNFSSQSALLKFLLTENVAGQFPYTAGVFPYRHTTEQPTRMFAGEGTPEDTNARFFYLIAGQATKRLSTAFDPISLYGRDPAIAADVYGCIGMSGVSVSNLDDMKKLYSGIDLCDQHTSVSMTINGPAAVFLAWFFNVAIDQQVEIHLKSNGLWPQAEKTISAFYEDKERPEYHCKLPQHHNGLGLATLGIGGQQLVDEATYAQIKSATLKKIRGTLQADILKEELAQNECIFSLSFGLQLMGDMQQYFITNNIKRFYSVSVSGYHIAEAGANPVTQLAFTLANGFTLVEYYLSRGMHIDEFASQFSFFFSNGMDPEYAVIGRVARRIWARAMRYRYQANGRSQRLKYHIQTSGRSLQAQDIELNDIRTTLQALYAVYDNCNSLHTNAYDEAVTTPTEESVHRALAIQLIINSELGLNINQNPLQGSYIIQQLTEQVEQAVYAEFERLSERGGVLGAIETFYQRDTIQRQNLYYENKKNIGDLPVIGVNSFVREAQSHSLKRNLVRSSGDKKHQQIAALKLFKDNNRKYSQQALATLKETIKNNQNSFDCLMEVSKVCSLGQISDCLSSVGGEYRRKM